MHMRIARPGAGTDVGFAGASLSLEEALLLDTVTEGQVAKATAEWRTADVAAIDALHHQAEDDRDAD